MRDPTLEANCASKDGAPGRQPAEFTTQSEVDQYIAKLETEMREAARPRDSIKELREKEFLFG